MGSATPHWNIAHYTAVLCCVVLCRVVLCRVVSCRVELCCVASCHVLLYNVPCSVVVQFDAVRRCTLQYHAFLYNTLKDVCNDCTA